MTRAFLNVERSASGRRWKARLEDARIAEAISQRHELPEILGRVLAARGVGIDEADAFLNPTLRTLMPQPSALRDMEKGAARLADAVMTAEKIGVIADYDVDGVSSAAMLQSVPARRGQRLRRAYPRPPDRRLWPQRAGRQPA